MVPIVRYQHLTLRMPRLDIADRLVQAIALDIFSCQRGNDLHHIIFAEHDR